jgi:hypothetical protein
MAHAELVWEHPAQEFQRRPEDAELNVNFAFRNDGKTPVTVTKVTSSCGCATAELPKKTYAPGESGTLTSKFTFGGRRGMQAKSISVATDDGKTAQLSFQCLILDEPLVLSPAFVWWRVGEAAKAKPVDVAIADPGKLHITAVASSNPRIAATLNASAPGEKSTVQIQPADTARQETAQVFVQTDFPPEGPKAYVIEVRIK